jgi:hypothetical protein
MLEKSARNEELLNLYSLPNVIRNIESRRVRWTGYEAWKHMQLLDRQTRREQLARKTRHRWNGNRVKPRIVNNSVYEQVFRTQSVSDDTLS